MCRTRLLPRRPCVHQQSVAFLFKHSGPGIQVLPVSWWAGQPAFVMWQVKFPKRWYDIDDRAQQQITAAWQRGSPTVQFSVCKSARKGLWNSYSIDFRTMEQTNIESGRIRAVRWTGTPLGIEDAPRGKRMEAASSSNEGGVAAGPGVEDEVERQESTLQVTTLGSSSNVIGNKDLERDSLPVNLPAAAQRKSTSSHNATTFP